MEGFTPDEVREYVNDPAMDDFGAFKDFFMDAENLGYIERTGRVLKGKRNRPGHRVWHKEYRWTAKAKAAYLHGF